MIFLLQIKDNKIEVIFDWKERIVIFLFLNFVMNKNKEIKVLKNLDFLTFSYLFKDINLIEFLNFFSKSQYAVNTYTLIFFFW